MFNSEEYKVERPALHQLHNLGWQYLPPAALKPRSLGGSDKAERDDLRDVVLVGRLKAALRKLNPWISAENLDKVMRQITHPSHVALMEYNKAIHDMLVNYISVEEDTKHGRRGQTVKFIDFDHPDNNDFVCTNQFAVDGATQRIKPDIVCFVNGLPLAVIECKANSIADPLAEGIEQLRRYANLREPTSGEGAPKLFWYNHLMVSTCRDQARVGTISSSAQYYSDWKDAYPFSDDDIRAQLAQPLPKNTNQAFDRSDLLPPATYVQIQDGALNPQQRLLAGMFSRANFLDLLQNFTIYEHVDGRLIKKIARYQQYRAVKKVIERLKSGSNRKEKSGIIWHTQGSGKSLTMVMLAIKMRRDPELRQYKLVFVTDRTQLDAQLTNTFRGAQSETLHNAKSVADLKFLLSRDSSDIVTATVQKFQEAEAEGDFENLNVSDKIIVLADEAHRTQFGNLAATINAALPNAPKIGFTGTPLLKNQKMDKAFGGYVDEYRINEAVEDGATVRIIYEGRQVKTQVIGDSLDALFAEYFSDLSPEAQSEIKKKYGIERAVREAPKRIQWVCIDLLKHYREKIQGDGFKAMIVVGSRYAAILFHQALEALGGPPSEVIISSKHNDPDSYKDYTDATRQKKVINDFTKPLGTGEGQDPTAFLIVKDMLLTGFDAPVAQVMYIDRSLKEHGLMQAIARVNRTYPGKDAGFVVDYYGLSDNLTEALDMFSSEDVEGTYYTLKEELPRLAAEHTRVANVFKGLKSSDVDVYVDFLKDEDVRQQFDLAFKRFAKQIDIVLPDPRARAYTGDLKLWGKVQHAARNRYREPGLNILDVGAKVRKLVEDHIVSTGVDPKIPPIDLMAANFRQALDLIKSPESRASEIESAIKHHITVNLDEDPEYYKSLSLRLQDIIEKNNGKWEHQVQLLLDLRDTIEPDRQQTAADLGLSETELAFYNILMAEVTRHQDSDTVSESIDDEVKEITQSLVGIFEEATQIIDFFAKDDEQKRMKRAIKHAIIGSSLLDASFDHVAIVPTLQERFMALAKTHFDRR